MKKLILIVLMLALVPGLVMAEDTTCAEPPAKDLAVGMKVVAQWKGDNWWVATIDKITGEYYEITYSDNTKAIKKVGELVPHPEVAYPNSVPPCFKAGDRVISVWQGNSWWKATVTKVTGDIAEITFSDNATAIHKFNELVKSPQ